MKKIFALAAIMMLYQAAGVSQACEETPIVVASAAYRSAEKPLSPGNVFADQNSGIEFVHVSGGCYCMGAVDGAGPGDATPAHQICVDDYYMGKYEVTQAQWKAVMGTSPATMNSCGDNCPVVNVSWNEVQEFTRRLNERTGNIYRLPTEAEWEYAVFSGEMQARNGAARPASSGGTRILRPVGWSEPNGLGIYDMLGSVWEWTADRYGTDYYKSSPQYNPEGPQTGRYRSLRGGSWDDNQHSIQPTARIQYEPWIKRSWVGFRLISPDQSSAKFRDVDVLAVKESAGRNQCELVRHVAIQ